MSVNDLPHKFCCVVIDCCTLLAPQNAGTPQNAGHQFWSISYTLNIILTHFMGPMCWHIHLLTFAPIQ